jgi:multisubunit Na+/H+ antiporter MnhG subunit
MDNNHGHTVAAWVTTILAILGSTVASVAFVVADVNVAIIGIIVTVTSPFVGLVLRQLGYGQKAKR